MKTCFCPPITAKNTFSWVSQKLNWFVVYQLVHLKIKSILNILMQFFKNTNTDSLRSIQNFFISNPGKSINMSRYLRGFFVADMP